MRFRVKEDAEDLKIVSLENPVDDVVLRVDGLAVGSFHAQAEVFRVTPTNLFDRGVRCEIDLREGRQLIIEKAANGCWEIKEVPAVEGAAPVRIGGV